MDNSLNLVQCFALFIIFCGIVYLAYMMRLEPKKKD